MAAYIHDNHANSQMALFAILFRELQISFVFSFLLDLNLKLNFAMLEALGCSLFLGRNLSTDATCVPGMAEGKKICP